MSYASGTTVAPERSREEIERVLARYGAQKFMYGWDQEAVVIAFVANGRHIRFSVAAPDPGEFAYTDSGRQRKQSAINDAVAQETRRRWRSLVLVIKAKLEAIDSGISDFDREFLGFIVLPNGQTVADYIVPEIERAYETGKMPALALEGPKK